MIPVSSSKSASQEVRHLKGNRNPRGRELINDVIHCTSVRTGKLLANSAATAKKCR